MRMSIIVRRASQQDAAIVSALNVDVQDLHAKALPWLFKTSGSGTFNAADAAELLAKENHLTFLCELNGQAAGYVVAEIQRKPDTPIKFARDTIYIHHISVRPECRKRGAGHALLNAVKSHGKSLGLTTLALDTWAFNDDALAFFQREGLVPYNIKLWAKIT